MTEKDKKSFPVSIGQFGKIINILKDNKCKKVLFAGKVSKPNFYKLKLDFKGIYYIPRIIKASKLGAAAILKDNHAYFEGNKQSHRLKDKENFQLTIKSGASPLANFINSFLHDDHVISRYFDKHNI